MWSGWGVVRWTFLVGLWCSALILVVCAGVCGCYSTGRVVRQLLFAVCYRLLLMLWDTFGLRFGGFCGLVVLWFVVLVCDCDLCCWFRCVYGVYAWWDSTFVVVIVLLWVVD